MSDSPETVRADLQVVAKARLFFGHQSVGGNILSGVQAWADELKIPLRVLSADEAPQDSQSGLFHTKVGKNLEPETKCEAFETWLDKPVSPYYDAAILKFCFVDLEPDSHVTSPEKLFERYQATVASIRDKHPELKLVYTTMPLEADPPGFKTRIKRWIGKATWKDADNRSRAEFNSKIREAYGDSALFDIAHAESHFSGSISAFNYDGNTIETLDPRLTTDGGHLNETGQRHVAAAFLHAIAERLRRQ